MVHATTTCFGCLERRSLTSEHVILQALGGRLKKKLYCPACNREFGKGIDARLAESFGYVSTILRIHRERGCDPPVEVKEVETNLPLEFDGAQLRRRKPIVNIRREGKGILVDVTARSENERDNIMRSLRSKYNLPAGGQRFQETRGGPVDTMFSEALNSTEIKRAVTKIAYSLLCDRVPTRDVCGSVFDETSDWQSTALLVS